MTRDAEYLETRTPQPGGKDGHFIEASLYYSKGGVNYWSGGIDPRGLWVSFTPVEVISSGSDDRVMLKRTTIGDSRGRRIHLKELQRKNKKQGEAAAAAFRSKEEQIMWAAAHADWPKVKFLLGSVIH